MSKRLDLSMVFVLEGFPQGTRMTGSQCAPVQIPMILMVIPVASIQTVALEANVQRALGLFMVFVSKGRK